MEVLKDDELYEVGHWDATLRGDSADLFLVLLRETKN
jgi:hypothetical protein